jgi:hypothetical protein
VVLAAGEMMLVAQTTGQWKTVTLEAQHHEQLQAARRGAAEGEQLTVKDPTPTHTHARARAQEKKGKTNDRKTLARTDRRVRPARRGRAGQSSQRSLRSRRRSWRPCVPSCSSPPARGCGGRCVVFGGRFD